MQRGELNSQSPVPEASTLPEKPEPGRLHHVLISPRAQLVSGTRHTLRKSLEQSLLWSRELSVLSVNCLVPWEVPFPPGTVSVTSIPREQAEDAERSQGPPSSCQHLHTGLTPKGMEWLKHPRTAAGLGEVVRWETCPLRPSLNKITPEGVAALAKETWRKSPLSLQAVTLSSMDSGDRNELLDCPDTWQVLQGARQAQHKGSHLSLRYSNG